VCTALLDLRRWPPMEWAVKDRPALLAVAGAVLGVGGAAASVLWTPEAAVVAGLGALIASAGVLLRPRRDTDDSMARTEADEAVAILPPIVPVDEAVETPQDELAATGAPTQARGSGLSDPTDPRAGATGGSPPANAAPPALTDPETGLFSEDYFNIAIEARIAAARRHLRPVGVVMLEVVEGMRVGRIQSAEPKRVAEAIQETLREADTACRRVDGRFALLLEDTPENGAIWTVERIRRFLSERDPSLTLWAGVACYPAHGFSSNSLITQAGEALDAAREWRQDRIEVAAGE
jgi:GGDEF domain-containing protein